MNKNFRNVFTEQQRVIILQLLAADNDCSLNNRLLQKGLGMFGHNITIDKINTECMWLQDQGLVEVEEVSPDISVINLTEAGLDVVERRRVVPGIDMPVRGI